MPPMTVDIWNTALNVSAVLFSMLAAVIAWFLKDKLRHLETQDGSLCEQIKTMRQAISTEYAKQTEIVAVELRVNNRITELLAVQREDHRSIIDALDKISTKLDRKVDTEMCLHFQTREGHIKAPT